MIDSAMKADHAFVCQAENRNLPVRPYWARTLQPRRAAA